MGIVERVLTSREIERGWELWDESDDFLYLKLHDKVIAVFAQEGALPGEIHKEIDRWERTQRDDPWNGLGSPWR